MPSSADLKILVLDDDPDDTLLIADAIDDIPAASHAVTVTHTPEEATEQLGTQSFDIVLCDYRLGKIEGTEFIAEMRERGNDVPVILLTGRNDKAADEAALSAGAADFICKSELSPETIDRSIRYAIANARRQRLMSAVLSSLDAAVCVRDADQRPTLWNPAFLDLATSFAGGVEPAAAVERLCAKVEDMAQTQTIKARVLDKTVNHLDDGRSVITLHDVTEYVQALHERQRAESKAAHLARHCTLTELPNRNAFAERLARQIKSSTDRCEEFYLLTLNIRRFKEINDVFGHEMGDELLKKVARRLERCCPDTGFLARIGGDEFAFIQPKSAADGDKPAICDAIVEAMDQGFVLADKIVNTKISLGVAVFPMHGATVQQLLNNADIALYRSKSNPGFDVCIYDSELDQVVRERRILTADLKQAIEDQEIDVYFQPQARIADGQLTGFEALARWNHAEHGFVSPAVFVPIAEDNGLIEEIGRQVLRRACQYAADWPKPVAVAVNLSGLQIRQSDLVTLVHTTLLETGLAPNRLELEVTESVLIDDYVIALKVLRGIKNLGVSLAMDDFGTGYSSLSSLITFPFDKLKIDRSFVMELDSKKQLSTIVRTIVGLGKNLGIRTIAEGVEKPSHVEFLAQQQCDEVQGFLIGKPMDNDAVLEILNASDLNMLAIGGPSDQMVA